MGEKWVHWKQKFQHPSQPPISHQCYQQSTDLSKQLKKLKINTLHLTWGFLEMLYVTIKIFFNILSKTGTLQNQKTSLKQLGVSGEESSKVYWHVPSAIWEIGVGTDTETGVQMGRIATEIWNQGERCWHQGKESICKAKKELETGKREIMCLQLSFLCLGLVGLSNISESFWPCAGTSSSSSSNKEKVF